MEGGRDLVFAERHHHVAAVHAVLAQSGADGGEGGALGAAGKVDLGSGKKAHGITVAVRREDSAPGWTLRRVVSGE